MSEPKCLCRVKTTPGEFGFVMVEIQYCPMHKAAPDLLDALKSVLESNSIAAASPNEKRLIEARAVLANAEN